MMSSPQLLAGKTPYTARLQGALSHQAGKQRLAMVEDLLRCRPVGQLGLPQDLNRG
jgi:hypothetical protein